MNRFPDWTLRLAEFLEQWSSVQFEWGRTDCCQFVGAAVLALTGEDRRDLFAGYDSEMGAGRILVKHDGMEGLLTSAFGEASHVALAQRGDVTLCDFGRGPAASICVGALCVAPSEAGGLEYRPMRRATAAWKI